ncbi:calmodulin-binding protein 60 A-like [Salvia miltiorrhiza]|uniref:calmodulin-binding protein 60 A-like n=1 Tax=Salvia miltiorrhiza TaxID=226208 RepID=UPI0025ABEF46|nr:calmodulin-binding protein 60 A-like [Salvia miltiorrhiza]
MEHDEINGASSDPGQALALTIRKIMEKELEPLVLKMVSAVIKPMVITTVQQEIVPLAEDLIRRVVKEVFQPVEEKLLNGGSRDELPKGGSLQLKFLDDVSDTVTGEELKGIKYECLKLALLNPDGNIVASGRESSAKVEILLLHDNGNDDITIENFERSIIQTGEKKKPHFAKSVYISLKEGVGDLNGLKLGHDKDWIKLCNCRLGARIGQNLEGTTVQEAWTLPFKVTDKRDKQYDKHPLPFLSSEVWRLEGVCRNGKRCDRLKDKNIKTLQDFLFWFHVNPEELQKQILRVGDGAWKTTVTHAETCIVDDKKMYSHKSSTEPQMRVVYDVVGELKGVIDESHFVPIHNLSPDRKDRARNLLSSVLEVSAFGERYNNVEASLLHELPLQHCWNGSGLTLSENMKGYDSGPSSDSLGSKEMGELCNPTSGLSPADPVPRVSRDGEIHKCVGNNKVKYVEDFRHFENHSCPTSMLLMSENNKHKRSFAASSSGRSNDSFDSARSAMEKGWFDDEDCYRPGPPSPDLMLPYADDTYSYNTRASGHCYEETSRGHGCDEVDPPKGWKKLYRLWSTLRERVSVDVSSSHKKRRVG